MNREQFKQVVRRGRTVTLLYHVMNLMNGQRDPYYGTVRTDIEEYAKVNGWGAVLDVIAEVQSEVEDPLCAF